LSLNAPKNCATSRPSSGERVAADGAGAFDMVGVSPLFAASPDQVVLHPSTCRPPRLGRDPDPPRMARPGSF
jgi:hypothetical protein